MLNYSSPVLHTYSVVGITYKLYKKTYQFDIYYNSIISTYLPLKTCLLKNQFGGTYCNVHSLSLTSPTFK